MPVRIIFFSGLVLALFSFVIMLINALAISLKFFGLPELFNFMPQGITSLNLIELFFQSGVFVALGVIGEYVGRIYEQTKGRPTFLVKKVIGSLDK